MNTYEETDVNKMLKNFKSISISNKKNDIETFLLEKLCPQDMCITMGAGDIVKVGENLLGK